MHNASSQHGPDEMPVREILEKTNRFLSAVFLWLVQALLDRNLYGMAKKQHPRKARCQPDCTFPTALVDTFQLEHLYAFPNVFSCIWSRAPEKNMLTIWQREAKNQILTLVHTSSGVELQRCLGTCSQVSCGTWLPQVSVTQVQILSIFKSANQKMAR